MTLYIYMLHLYMMVMDDDGVVSVESGADTDVAPTGA